jgi:hypothetical protein
LALNGIPAVRREERDFCFDDIDVQGGPDVSVHDLIRRNETSLKSLSPQELVARYQRLRAVCKRLNNAVLERLPKDALHEGGRKLGLLQGDTFVFDSQYEMDVLMDYCLYHVRRGGRNVVEQYVHSCPPMAGTDEGLCLRAMQNAIHSLFRVDDVERGVGLAVTDLATDEQYLLVDIGLSQSAQPGLLILSRLLLFDDFAATSGAALVLGQLRPGERDSFAEKWKRVSTSRELDYDPGPLIREYLQRPGGASMRYLDPPSAPVRDPQLLRATRKQRVATLKRSEREKLNRRCPCGSGKMFKNCCLKKPR